MEKKDSYKSPKKKNSLKKGKMKRKPRLKERIQPLEALKPVDIEATKVSIPPSKTIDEVAKLLVGLNTLKKEINQKQPIEDVTNVQEIIKQKALNEHQVELLKAMVSEYLKNFIVMGYDMKGDRVLISNASTSHDRDAMLQMSQTVPIVLLQMFNGPPPER